MKKIIVAPYFMHKDLLEYYHKENAFITIKLMSKEEMLLSAYGEFLKDAIPFLMKKEKINYANAISILKYLPYVNSEVDETTAYLLNLKRELNDNGLIRINKYIDYELQNSEIFIHGYSNNDKELLHFIKTRKLQVHFINSKKEPPKYTYKHFENGDEEVFSVLNNIAKLIDNGIDINCISIVAKNKEYDYYLKQYAPLFGFNLNIDSESIFTRTYCSRFLKDFKINKDIALSLNNLVDDEEEIVSFKDIVKNSICEGFTFEQQYDYLCGVLKGKRLPNTKYKNGLNVLRDLPFKEDNYIFVLGFSQGSYPLVKKDVDYLSNEIKAKLCLNATFDTTSNSFDVIKDFLNSDNRIYLSYSSAVNGASFHPSSLILQFDMKEEKNGIPDVIYSQTMADYLFAKYVDLAEIYYEKDINYRSFKRVSSVREKYDNSFSGVNVFNEHNRFKHSYSAIKSYYQCPFQYYLNYVLGIKEPLDDVFIIKVGNLFHEVLRAAFNDDFHFEETYRKVYEEQSFSNAEKVLMRRLKKQLEVAVSTSLLHAKHYMNNPKVFTEKPVEYVIDHNTCIFGVIDKAIILNNQYLVLVDYKTGSESFNPDDIQYGQSLQLPTYLLLASQCDEFKDLDVAGIYINNIINNSTNEENCEDKILPPYLKLNGRTISDPDIIYEVDTTFDGNESTFLKGVKLVKKDGTYGKYVVSKGEMVSYRNQALEKFKQADTNIRNNHFEIAPLYLDKDNPCGYCPYKDICFLKNEQKVKVSTKEEKEDAVV